MTPGVPIILGVLEFGTTQAQLHALIADRSKARGTRILTLSPILLPPSPKPAPLQACPATSREGPPYTLSSSLYTSPLHIVLNSLPCSMLCPGHPVSLRATLCRGATRHQPLRPV